MTVTDVARVRSGGCSFLCILYYEKVSLLFSYEHILQLELILKVFLMSDKHTNTLKAGGFYHRTSFCLYCVKVLEVVGQIT